MQRSGELVIFANGKPLMSSRMHGSEEALATLACAAGPDPDAPSVLVGGLGMGFTLRATLDALPAVATVIVAELLPAVVDWNRGVLGPLAGEPLRDRRVSVALGDVVGRRSAPTGTPSMSCSSTSTTGPPRSPRRANGGALRRPRAGADPPRVEAWRCARRVVGVGRSEVRTAPPLRPVQGQGRARARAVEAGRAASHDLPRLHLGGVISLAHSPFARCL